MQIENIPRIARARSKLVLRKEKNVFENAVSRSIYLLELTRLVFYSDIIDVSHVIVTIPNYRVEWLVPVQLKDGIYQAVISASLPFRYVLEETADISLREIDIVISHSFNKFQPITILSKINYSSFLEHGGNAVKLYEIFVGSTVGITDGDILDMDGYSVTVLSKTATTFFSNGPAHGLPISGTRYRLLARESLGMTIVASNLTLSFAEPHGFLVGATITLQSYDAVSVHGFSGVITATTPTTVRLTVPFPDETNLTAIVWCYLTVAPSWTNFNWTGVVSDNYMAWSNRRGVFARYADSFLFLSIFESYGHAVSSGNRVSVEFASNDSIVVPETTNYLQELKDCYVVSVTSSAIYCLTFPIAFSNDTGVSNVSATIRTIWLESLTLEFHETITVIHYNENSFIKKFEPNEIVRLRPMTENILDVGYTQWYNSMVAGVPVSYIVPNKIILNIGYGTSGSVLVSRSWEGFISPPALPPYIETELTAEFNVQ